MKFYTPIKLTEEQEQEFSRLLELWNGIKHGLAEEYGNVRGSLSIDDLEAFVHEEFPNTKAGEKDYEIALSAIWAAIKEINLRKKYKQVSKRTEDRGIFLKEDIEFGDTYFVSPELGKVETEKNLEGLEKMLFGGVSYTDESGKKSKRYTACFYLRDPEGGVLEDARTRKFKQKLLPTFENLLDILSAAEVFSIAYAWSLKAIEKGENLSEELTNKVLDKVEEMKVGARMDEKQMSDITSAAYTYAKKNKQMSQSNESNKATDDEIVLFAAKGPTSLKGIEGRFPILGKTRIKRTKRIVKSEDANLVFTYTSTRGFRLECCVKAADVSGKEDPNEDDDE